MRPFHRCLDEALWVFGVGASGSAQCIKIFLDLERRRELFEDLLLRSGGKQLHVARQGVYPGPI